MKKTLVTGGTGYIGSHTCVELLERDYDVVVFDNLSNSKQKVLSRIEKLAGRAPHFYKADLLDKSSMRTIFTEHSIDAVIHFAGKKAVGESVEIPLDYYQNNVTGTLNLCEVMNEFDVKNIVFSSSCTVYGQTPDVPLKEEAPLSANSPYGRTKLIIEWILRDQCRADGVWNAVLLRYFNPIGAHPSGEIGEDPTDIPNNLMPYITQVAVGKLDQLSVFGDDYDTRDGTGVRDYIHVVDLAIGHIKALEKLGENPGDVAYNLGTGKGYSVLEVIKAFERATGQKIPYKITGRRPGDVAEAWADPYKAKKELDWEAERGIEEMCRDAWNWQSKYKDGY
jgi:UDP-glucose 4-epimerase